MRAYNVDHSPRALYVSFSPHTLRLFPLSDCVVVVVDVFRATTTLTALLHYHPDIDVELARSVQDALARRKPGVLVGGEWKARVPTGFDLGNSPEHYCHLPSGIHRVVFFTTNAVPLIWQVQEARQVLIGSFWNLSALATYLRGVSRPVLIACSSWRGHPCIEDILLAGALVHKLRKVREAYPDEPYIALHLWERALQEGLENYVDRWATHSYRLREQGAHHDVSACLRIDRCNVIPVVKNGKVLRLSGAEKGTEFSLDGRWKAQKQETSTDSRSPAGGNSSSDRHPDTPSGATLSLSGGKRKS